MFILSILSLEYSYQIQFLYQHFLSSITENSLNAFHYSCSHLKVDYSRFMNTAIRIALKLIPNSLQAQLVFLCVVDTITRIIHEAVSKLKTVS